MLINERGRMRLSRSLFPDQGHCLACRDSPGLTYSSERTPEALSWIQWMYKEALSC